MCTHYQSWVIEHAYIFLTRQPVLPKVSVIASARQSAFSSIVIIFQTRHKNVHCVICKCSGVKTCFNADTHTVHSPIPHLMEVNLHPSRRSSLLAVNLCPSWRSISQPGFKGHVVMREGRGEAGRRWETKAGR